MTKNELRKQIRARLAELSPAAQGRRSTAACDLLAQQPEFTRAQTLMIYLATPGEVDTSEIAFAAWSRGKRVAAPWVAWEQKRMIPMEIRSLGELREGLLGVPQPPEESPVSIAEIDLLILPGLAFDAHGNRLGRGRGFFDRFLAHREFRAVKCALAFEEQFVEAVPADAHDQRVDLLVTDAAVRRFGDGAS